MKMYRIFLPLIFVIGCKLKNKSHDRSSVNDTEEEVAAPKEYAKCYVSGGCYRPKEYTYNAFGYGGTIEKARSDCVDNLTLKETECVFLGSINVRGYRGSQESADYSFGSYNESLHSESYIECTLKLKCHLLDLLPQEISGTGKNQLAAEDDCIKNARSYCQDSHGSTPYDDITFNPTEDKPDEY